MHRVVHFIVFLAISLQVTHAKAVFHAEILPDFVGVGSLDSRVEEITLLSVFVEKLQIVFSDSSVQSDIPSGEYVFLVAVSEPVFHCGMACQ